MDPLEFKYHGVDANGNEAGFFASRGTLTETELILDGVSIPLVSIYQVISRYSRLTLVYHSAQGQATFTFAPKRGLDRKLKETIDRLCSYRWAEERHAQLNGAGQGAAFRTNKCPACTAVVDLSGFAETPQFYCVYCESLQSSEHQVEAPAAGYRLCDRCRFYSWPTRYTATYIVLNVVSWRQHYSCHVCMRRECWKMLAVNLLPPFIGEALAIYNTIRAYGAGMMDSYLPELMGANAYAAKGRMDSARPIYEAMLERVPIQAGLRYNLALGYAKAELWEECLEAAHAALNDCSNYTPAATLIHQALTQLDQADQAEQFVNRWGIPATIGAKPPPLPIDTEAIQSGLTDDKIRGE